MFKLYIDDDKRIEIIDETDVKFKLPDARGRVSGSIGQWQFLKCHAIGSGVSAADDPITIINTTPTGSSQAFDIMQPTVFIANTFIYAFST